MEFVVNGETLINLAKIIGAIGVIGGLVTWVYTWCMKIKKYDSEIRDIKEEQCMQTYVLEAVLDGLHQLGCNGKTTEASEKLSKFVNKRAHGQDTK